MHSYSFASIFSILLRSGVARDCLLVWPLACNLTACPFTCLANSLQSCCLAILQLARHSASRLQHGSHSVSGPLEHAVHWVHDQTNVGLVMLQLHLGDLCQEADDTVSSIHILEVCVPFGSSRFTQVCLCPQSARSFVCAHVG